MRQSILDRYGRTVQQSMTVDPRDYAALNLTRPMLGIVMSVNPADSTTNRSAFQTGDYRGCFATATVLIVRDGRDVYLPIDNVIITPDSISGLDSYYERLPRGCSSDIRGNALNSTPTNIWDLDGDWCVVGWLGGSMDSPFILRWWPHPRNPHDPATSGRPDPLHPASSSTLDQHNRHFVRVNGVEYVVTQRGDVYLSTYRANSTLSFGNDLSPEQGRFRRTLDDENGGGIKVWVKPSQVMELDWNQPEDGIGLEDLQDDNLPQTNPGGRNTSDGTKDNTFWKIDKDRVLLEVPEQIKLHSKKRILLNSDEETTLTVGGKLKLDATGDIEISTDGKLSADVTQNLDVTVTGQATITARTTLSVQVTGQATINSMADLTLSSTGVLSLAGSQISIGAGGASGGPGSITGTDAGLTLGTGSLGGAVGGDGLQAALTAFATAVQTAQSSATVESAYAAAITAAAQALSAAIASAVSSTTRVG